MTKPLAFLALASITSIASAQSVVAYSKSYITPMTGWGYSDTDDRGNSSAHTRLEGTAGTASGDAWGDFGGMRTRGSLQVGPSLRAQGFGRLTVTDSLNIVSPDYVGGGTLRLTYSLTGAVNVAVAPNKIGGSFYAQASNVAVIFANTRMVDTRYLEQTVSNYYPNGTTNDQFGLRTIDISFDAGYPIYLETVVSSSAYLENASGGITADFGSTFKWTGAEVLDSQGNTLSNASVMGASGLDYVNPQPVPEPATLGVLAVGGLGILRRRNRR